mgnify:CR=1 FL=1
MNVAGLQNRAGEIMKRVAELLTQVKVVRKAQADSKYAYEDAEQRLGDLQAFLYSNLMQSTEIKWANPNPVMLADGTTPMPEFEAQYRSMYANWLIQQNEGFQTLLKERNTAKEDYYQTEQKIVSLMEEIGISKAEMALIAGLLRLADDV